MKIFDIQRFTAKSPDYSHHYLREELQTKAIKESYKGEFHNNFLSSSMN